MKKETIIFGDMGSPVTHVSIDEREVREILITYGGGMGGMHENRYAYSTKGNFNNDKFVQCTLINGTEENLNTDKIVRTRKGKIVILKTDVTKHSHFNEEKYAKKVIVEYFFFKEGEEYKYIPDSRNRTVREKRTVLKEVFCS